MSRYVLLKIMNPCWVLGIFLSGYAWAQTGNYIIVFKDHSQKHAMLQRPEFASARSFTIIPALADKIDSRRVEELKKDANIAYIEPDYPLYALGPVGSGNPSAGIGLGASSQTIPYGITMIGAPLVWPKTRGAGAVVAVLDTGISMYHPDRGNVLKSISFVSGEGVEDGDGHGTHTSGTIAAADNDIGVVGVAPEADLLIAKVLDNTGTGQTSWLISGIEWAVQNGANVISMSLGGPDNAASLETACDQAFGAGVLLVAAAGNDNSAAPSYPAAFASVVSVAAVDQNKQKAAYSNFGPTIALAAPGDNVLSTIAVGDAVTGSATWSGTNHSANPIQGTIAGTVAGRVCDCGLATGLDQADSCPDIVAGNIALIRRGGATFAQKVAYAKSRGAVGVVISNNVSGLFNGTLSGVGTRLVVVSISQADGDALVLLAQSGESASVSVNIPSTSNPYAYDSGTSMAAPHVSGAAALIFAAQGTALSPTEVRNILENSAQDLGAPGRDDLFGYGLVDVNAAFTRMRPKTCNAVWILGYGLSSDLDRDCYVGLKDLALFAAEWLSQGCGALNGGCNGADIDRSNAVSVSDFAGLAAQWLMCNDPANATCTPNWP
jgi:subtilisin family serine protease